MRTYSIPLSSVLKTKKRHFYWMLYQVERLHAYEDIRQLRLISTEQNPTVIQQTADALDLTLGTIYSWAKFIPPKFEMNENDNELDPEFDRVALRALKARHGA